MRILHLIAFLMVAISGASQQQNTNIADLPESYTFTWVYDLSVGLNGKKLDMTYYIEPDAKYYGFAMKLLPTILSITDSERNLTIKTFGKTATVSHGVKKPKPKPNASEHRFTKLPEKVILGTVASASKPRTIARKRLFILRMKRKPRIRNYTNSCRCTKS